MITVEIDTTGIRDIIRAIEDIEENRMPSLTSAATRSTSAVKDRITKGMTSDGKLMESKSLKKKGRYSRQWGNKRAKNGLKTSVITLSFTGRTIRSLTRIHDFSAYKDNSVIIGLDNDEAQQIAEWNNEMFGAAYDYSKSEIDRSFEQYLEGFGNNILIN